METLREPYQGVKNIISFNWHFYALSLWLSITLWAFSFLEIQIHPNYLRFPSLLIFLVTLISLLASTYIYDISGLYSLKWMDKLQLGEPHSIVNVNAGFDETSVLLKQKFQKTELYVLDFYNPEKHTEVSIKRARKAHPPYPGTLRVSTDKLPLAGESIEVVFAILSAHEVRNKDERVLFFKEIKRILNEGGKIVVTEHLRDVPNFIAYTIGFFHFHSKKTWLKTFKDAGLQVNQEIKITPFLSTFVLKHA